MLYFDSRNPYPQIDERACTYAEAQEHSAQVDDWIGLQTAKIENQLIAASEKQRAREAGHQAWIGLPVKALLTPYTELRTLLALIDPQAGETVVDLGAGYGRMGFVLSAHYPDVSFVGYELVRERVDEGNRCFVEKCCSRAYLIQGDLSDPEFKLHSARYYFLYDFGSRAAIDKTLDDLRQIAQARAIVVVGRGRASRDAIERRNPWLSQVVEPSHHGHFTIYRSAVTA